MIILDNISVEYNNRIILKNVNMYCMAWQITILEWPNGWWKSSVFKIIVWNNKKYSWKVIFNETDNIFDVNYYKNNSFNNRIFWYLPQNNLLFEHLTCYENIEILFQWSWYKYKVKELNYYLKYFKLEKIMNNYPHEISLGQKQLIAFIRTILIDSQYLLLDEPTSALNIENINKVKNIILELKKLNKTVLIISHDKYFSESISDKNYYISDWSIIKK